MCIYANMNILYSYKDHIYYPILYTLLYCIYTIIYTLPHYTLYYIGGIEVDLMDADDISRATGSEHANQDAAKLKHIYQLTGTVYIYHIVFILMLCIHTCYLFIPTLTNAYSYIIRTYHRLLRPRIRRGHRHRTRLRHSAGHPHHQPH